MNNKKNVEFDIERNKELLDEVHNYFKREPKLKQIKVSNSINNDVNEEKTILKFNIEKKNEPIYEEISCFEDIHKVIENIKLKLDKLIENMTPIVKDKDCDENTKKSLRAIVSAIMNFKKNIIRLDRGTDKDSSLDKNKEKFIENLSKLIEYRIIKDCIQPIYQGMKHSENYIYDNLLIYINEWLQNLGIYTFKLNDNEKLDDEKYNYIDNIHSENTRDYSKHDLIKDIIQYPYIFSEDKIVCEGEVVIWRSE